METSIKVSVEKLLDQSLITTIKRLLNCNEIADKHKGTVKEFLFSFSDLINEYVRKKNDLHWEFGTKEKTIANGKATTKLKVVDKTLDGRPVYDMSKKEPAFRARIKELNETEEYLKTAQLPLSYLSGAKLTINEYHLLQDYIVDDVGDHPSTASTEDEQC